MSLSSLVEHYTDEFRNRMLVTAEQIDDAASTIERAKALPANVQELLDTLLLVADPGQPVEGMATRIDGKAGERLWQGGFLLPRSKPSRGSTIDPRYYAASCKLTPHLAGRRPFVERLAIPDVEPAFPPGDARWDAVVIAATLERSPLSLNRDGAPRRDQLDRMLKGLGDDPVRWTLALDVARATGRARPRSGKLVGLPESSARRVKDPVALLGDHGPAGRLLLRALSDSWLSVAELTVLVGELEPQIGHVVGMDKVADIFHRIGLVDAARDADGVIAVRRPSEGPGLPPGFLLTPDMEILVASGELEPRNYGRLARLAPYVDGDRVHRHRLTRQGVSLDMALGHDDPVGFLRELSRTGMPLSVEQSIHEWSRSAERLVLTTGATVTENPDGTFVIGPSEGREIDYAEEPEMTFSMQGVDAIVPVGKDALPVRSALARIATLTERTDTGWRYTLAPKALEGAEGLLDTLRGYHVDPDLPSELEVRVRSANGLGPARTEDAVVVTLPDRAIDALRRDGAAGPLLARELSHGVCVVQTSDVPALRRRLSELGVVLA